MAKKKTVRNRAVKKKVVEANNPKKKQDTHGLVFVACLFIGLGFGFALDNVVVGLFLGMGAGFLAMFITKAIMDKKGK